MDNYPLGAANDPRAPYNKKDPEPVEIDVCVSYTISKSTTIEGNPMEEDLKYIYESTEYTIPELMDEFIKLLKKEIAETNATIKMLDGNLDKAKKSLEMNINHYSNLLEAAQGWTVDECEVIKE